MLNLLLDASLVLVVGMGVVVLSLLMFAGLIVVLRASDERFNIFRIRRYNAKVEAAPAHEGVNDELVAVLTAAAAVAIRKPVRIRRMRFLDTASAGAWTSTGRLNIMASHAIPKRKPTS